MNEEARELVRRLLQEGKRYDEVRQAVISHGYDTAGFEREYPKIQKDLGITEPPPTPVQARAPQSTSAEDSKEMSEQYQMRGRSNVVVNVIKLLAGLVVIAAAAIVLSGYGGSIKDAIFGTNSDSSVLELTGEDISRQSNLKTMQTAARSYRSRLLDYDGVCGSIGIDRDIYTCNDSSEAYAIFTELSNGQFYCVDNTGYSGVVVAVAANARSCQE